MKKMNSGIYSIQNIINKKMYIGSSKNLRHRKDSHLCGLRKGGHGNHKLQKDFNKYGENSFSWCILEFTEESRLIEREQFWIDTINPEYNIVPKANSHAYNHTELTRSAAKKRGEKMRGRKQSDEEKKKRSISLLAYWSDPINRAKLKKTPEQKEHFRQMATGERNGNWGKKRPKEFKKLISNLFSSVQYTFISPEGKEITFNNLMSNGEKLTGLPYWQLRQLYKGKKKEYSGWTFKEKKFIGYKRDR